MPTWHGSPGRHLRLSRFPANTHPTADRAWCCLTFFFVCLLFRWSPIQVPTWHGSPGRHLRLSRSPAVTADRARCCLTLQAVIHPSADPAWCCWTSSSAVPFPVVTHPTAARARCCLTFFFDCLHFRRSPIEVPTWHGSPGLHLRLSRFTVGPVVTHPTADQARYCLTFFFDCLLFRLSPT